jgi:hypothetical protein
VVAEAGGFSPAWSNAIHTEWIRNRRDKFGDPISRLDYARDRMEKAFPGANFDPDPEVLRGISLPDQDDAHVVATAVAAGATSIVTYNSRHFPGRILAPLRLIVETPDEFCARIFGEDERSVAEGARLHRASLKRPTYDPSSYIDHLASLEFVRVAELLGPFQGLL